jgi:hypothetical protein
VWTLPYGTMTSRTAVSKHKNWFNIIGPKGGGVAELAAPPPMVPKVRGSNHGAD